MAASLEALKGLRALHEESKKYVSKVAAYSSTRLRTSFLHFEKGLAKLHITIHLTYRPFLHHVSMLASIMRYVRPEPCEARA